MNGARKKIYVTVGEAAHLTGLDCQTIRKMVDKDALVCYKTPAGQRRIHTKSIQEFCNQNVLDKKIDVVQKENFVYARVSSKKQVDDLSRQVEFLRSRDEYSDYRLITDVASGINFKRKGLATILDSCIQGNIGEVVVAHRDRLCRFGFELIEQLVTKAGGKIIVLENSENKTSEQELAEDLLSIIHVFSCRQMGKRSYACRKNKNVEDKDISNSEPKDDN